MKSFRPSLMVTASMVAALTISAFGQTADFTTGQAARLVIGQKTFTNADFGASNTLLGAVSGIAIASGNLIVADSNRYGASPINNRVVIFKDVASYPSPTDIPTIPGATCSVCRGQAAVVLGQPDFTTTTYSLNQKGLRLPTAVATDGKILAVADTDNNRILIWKSIPASNGQPADVVIGQADFTHGGTSIPPTAKSLRGPQGVWIFNGKLYVADTQDHRVLVYNQIPASNGAAADLVLGQPNFTSFVQPDLTQANQTPAANNLLNPVAVTTDGKKLFITDLGNNRVLIFNNLPTANGAAADIVLGQKDMVTSIENDTTHICASNGTDSTGAPIYPGRCGKTMSFPRFALSDGNRLFIADGGNDRVLIYRTIPTANTAAADIVLGQPDEFTLDTFFNPDGSNAFQTPTALAWDGTNLYVSDTFNRRVVVFSPGNPVIPLSGVRNAASLQIYAIGTVSIAGTITENDTIKVTINTTDYTYTVLKTDALTDIVKGIVKLINANQGDPNVLATPDLVNLQVDLTARKGGNDGGNITLATLAAAPSTAATGAVATETAAASGATLNIRLQDPTQIAPGTVVQVYGDQFTDNKSAIADYSKQYLPSTLAGAQVFIDGIQAPLTYASQTQINAQMPFEMADRTSVSLYVRTQHADGTVTVTTPVAVTIVPQNPGIFADFGTDPRHAFVFHGADAASGAVSVDGSVTAGDVGSITIGTETYTYTIVAGDTLDTIRDTFIAQINAGDPNVTAVASNQYDRIYFYSKIPGPNGEGLTYSAKVSSGTSLILTALGSTTCCANVKGSLVTTDNPAVPGEIVYVLATGLGPTNPSDIDTGKILPNSTNNPPVVPVDSVLAGGTTANIVNVSPMAGNPGIYTVSFQLSTNLTTNPVTQLTIAQQAFISNVVTFPVALPGANSGSGVLTFPGVESAGRKKKR